MMKRLTLAIVALGIMGAVFASTRGRDSRLTSYGREAKVQRMEKATFGAGCFWGVGAAFRKVPGVVSTSVGYTGGTAPIPTYEQVCAGGTGHTESVEVMYDPTKITYDDLLNVFWRSHDPTERHKAQYRSVIFYHTPEQKAAAEAAQAKLKGAGGAPVVTEILPAREFYPAEEYHQQYYDKRGILGGVCPR